MEITIETQTVQGTLPHFWRSTGFTPSSLIENPVLLETLDHLAGLPAMDDGTPAMQFVRIHNLLDLVSVKGALGANPVHDWSRLDAALDQLVSRRMRPIFEVMGDPCGVQPNTRSLDDLPEPSKPRPIFHDYSNPIQMDAWRRFVAALARHLIARYGQEEVRQWWFEDWNEPDTPWWPQSIEAFLCYHDATSQGLKDVDPNLIFGGPGTCCFLSPLLVQLLEHVERGKNRVTGQVGSRLDFISFHEKGAPWSAEDVRPRMDRLLDRTEAIRQHIMQKHPRLADRPLVNDECDPQVGWKDIHTWHARPFYAAWATRQIGEHLVRFIDPGYNFVLLGNDHGFVGTWGQRTLLTCFGDEADRQRGRYELIRKPILNAHLLWALQGDQRLRQEGDTPTGIGAIASRHPDGSIAVLLWNNSDNQRESGQTHLDLVLKDLGDHSWRLLQYRIDEGHSNPIAIWEDRGYHREPGPDLYTAMRQAQEVSLLEMPQLVQAESPQIKLPCSLPLHSVSLILLLPTNVALPETPTGLNGRLIPGRLTDESVFLTWLPSRRSQHLRRYVVEVEESPDSWREIDLPASIFSCVRFPRLPAPGGQRYRVLAEDHHGQRSAPSNAVMISIS